MVNVRNPVSPGRFYPADPDLVLQQVQACYGHPLGPGRFPGNNGSGPEAKQDAAGHARAFVTERPIALIVPHGALGHSGPIAAHAYAKLADSLLQGAGTPLELIVVLGPDHLAHGTAVSATSMAYASPCGVIPTDEERVRQLCEHAAPGGGPIFLSDTPAGHLYEHSIENQIPFLQHLKLALDRFGDATGQGIREISDALRLVPLTMSAQDLTTALALGELLDRELPASGVLVVATSDMSHCGPLYGNQPAKVGSDAMSISRWCQRQTAQAVAAIESMDPAAVIRSRELNGLSMCGVGCVAATLDFARRRGASHIRVLAVSDSVQVASAWRSMLSKDSTGIPLPEWAVLETVDPDNPVGFASFVLY